MKKQINKIKNSIKYLFRRNVNRIEYSFCASEFAKGNISKKTFKKILKSATRFKEYQTRKDLECRCYELTKNGRY